MKKVLFTFAFLTLIIVAAQAQTIDPPQSNTDNKTMPRFFFINGETHDFGTLEEGPEATGVFKFKNVGRQPLIIESINTSCPCAIATFQNSPILPGKNGEIKVTFNTAGRGGQTFEKIIFITSNAASNGPDKYEIHIKGNVAPAKD